MTGLSVHTEALAVRFGETTALSGVGLDLEPGRIHGLLGRNGAGKTTLLSVLASLRPPTEGTVRLDGREPFEDEALMEQALLIREGGDLMPSEDALGNLGYQQLARPDFDRDYAERLMEDFEIPRKRALSKLSRGQRSAFGVVVGLAARAPLTMFDEVHLGMDAPARQNFYEELVADFAEHPRTVIISSHLIHEIESLLETVTIVHRGRVLMTAEAEEVRASGATLTGPAAVVDEVAADHEVVGSRDLGPTRQVTVYDALDTAALDRAETRGLTVGPVPLQDLFIHLTDDREPR